MKKLKGFHEKYAKFAHLKPKKVSFQSIIDPLWLETIDIKNIYSLGNVILSFFLQFPSIYEQRTFWNMLHLILKQNYLT